jgi:hypothetical protein
MSLETVFWIGFVVFICYAAQRSARQGSTFIKNNDTARGLSKKAAEGIFKKLFG